MSLKSFIGFVPNEVIAAHRRGPEFAVAITRGDVVKAQRILQRILGDKDGQTAWYLTQSYADDPIAFEQLSEALSKAP
jgi:hypothetical protein